MLYFLYVFILIQCSQGEKQEINLNFHQSDYNIHFERVEVIHYNNLFVDHLRATTFKYNRSCTAVNASLNYKINNGSDLYLIIQAYKYTSNEYRLFPLRFAVKFCELFLKDIAGLGSLKCKNFVGCPSQKGEEYNVCNYNPDASKLPPLIPNGRYLIELQGMYREDEIWLANFYGEVFRPVWKDAGDVIC